jgi:hypothetical protein
MMPWSLGRLLGVLTVVFAAIATAACATAPGSSKAVTDVMSLAGRWGGTCDFGAGQQPCYILISQEGSFTGIAGSSSVFGRVNAVGGRGAFDAGASSGDIALYERETCQRDIVVTGQRGTAKGQLTQSGPAATRVSSVANLAGRWAGDCDLGTGPLACTATIGQDGSFSANAGQASAVGRVTVANGRATFEAGAAAGEIVLHEGAGCKRQISVVGSKGIARGFLAQQ